MSLALTTTYENGIFGGVSRRFSPLPSPLPSVRDVIPNTRQAISLEPIFQTQPPITSDLVYNFIKIVLTFVFFIFVFFIFIYFASFKLASF
jgi:hypothetical protein